jgi:hypothetical protein
MNTESFRNRINNIESQIIETESRKKRFEEFESISVLFVASKTAKELALWQSKYPQDSPQHIIANHEWQRRLNAEQIKSNRFSAYVGIVGVILGFILSSSYEFYKDSRKVNELNVTASKTANEAKNTAERPENSVPQIKEPEKEPINHALPQK